jgi:mycothiol synthase
MPTKILDHLIVRPATLDDLEAVLDLVTRLNLADYDEPMTSADSLRRVWQSPTFSLATDTWLLTTPDGHLAGYAQLQREGDTRFYPTIYVEKAYRGQGLGAHLLRLAEARAVASRGHHPHVVLTCRVSQRNTAGISTFEEAGYTRTLSFSMMEIMMPEPPAPPQWAEGIAVRTFMVGQDEQATYAADEEASEDKGYHSPLSIEAWARRMDLHGDSFDPALWFLACEGDQVAGVALCAYSQETHTGWVDHLGVRSKWRSQGIGMALLLHSFGEFYQRGTRRVKLSVDSHSLTHAPRLYRRAGMQAVQQYHVYRKELRFDATDEAAQAPSPGRPRDEGMEAADA